MPDGISRRLFLFAPHFAAVRQNTCLLETPVLSPTERPFAWPLATSKRRPRFYILVGAVFIEGHIGAGPSPRGDPYSRPPDSQTPLPCLTSSPW